jgi:16S rRNA (cytidine1402-2'-O)-methyltransferase
VTAGALFVVATPLGNLGDLSERALHVLHTADLVAAEDTRRARILLQRAGSPARVVSFHAHSPPARAALLLARLAEGLTVALITDAGTPGISDPGAALVRQARDAGHPVVPVPGPSAVATALSVSGLPADRYIFLGFIPRKGAARRNLLKQAAESPWTVVLFEAAPRLPDLLEDLAAVSGAGRAAFVARELTKIHEELKAGTVGSLSGYYRQYPPRGEVTLVLEGAAMDAAATAEQGQNVEAWRTRARALLAAGLSRRDAAGQLAAELGISRNAAYRVVTGL